VAVGWAAAVASAWAVATTAGGKVGLGTGGGVLDPETAQPLASQLAIHSQRHVVRVMRIRRFPSPAEVRYFPLPLYSARATKGIRQSA